MGLQFHKYAVVTTREEKSLCWKQEERYYATTFITADYKTFILSIQEILETSPKINGKATWNSRRKLKIRAIWHEKRKVSGLQNKKGVGKKAPPKKYR